MQEVLLEVLAQKCGCYISSLVSKADDPALAGVMLGLCLSDYSLQEWNYCLSYLYREKTEVGSYEELNAILARREAVAHV